VLVVAWIKNDGMKTYVCLAIIILFAEDLDSARGNGHTFFFLAVLFDHRAFILRGENPRSGHLWLYLAKVSPLSFPC
jgi:hypothetical protein